MKTKSIVMIVLSLLLVLSVISASAAEPETQTTVAMVAFRAATPEFVDPETDPDSDETNMNINFGTQDLPLGEETYTAEDGTHILRIVDRRTPAGGWSVHATLSSFVSDLPANEFDGTIKLGIPTYSEGLTPSSFWDLVSNDDPINIITADDDLTKGYFDVIWANKTISLYIDGTAAASITEAASYSADIIWTLDAT